MRTFEAIAKIVEIEEKIDVNLLKRDGLNLWPLLRHCLWVSFLSGTQKEKSTSQKNVLFDVLRVTRDHGLSFFEQTKDSILINSRACDDNQMLFLSRPVYLQKMNSGKWIDKIIDPIFF